jgi:predicted  nucleic acid-binding Zn-ribbon protein
MTANPNDLTPAPDTVSGKTGTSYTSAQLITMACHGVAETVFSPPDPKPKWFDDLNAKLGDAQVLANQWLDTLGQQVTQTIPLQVLNFGPTYVSTTNAILDIVKEHGSASGKDNQYVIEIKELIEQTLVPGVTDAINAIDKIAGDLETWGAAVTKAHNALSKGAGDIQSAEIALKGDIDKMNNAIKNLHTYIDNENKAIAASAAAIGIGVFALIVGVALAPETGGASLAIGGFIGAAGIIGGAVTWGVMQHKINEQFDEIAKDQKEKADDQRQLVALQGLSMASNAAVSNLSLASSALSKLRTQWGVFEGELQGVLKKLESAEDSISVIVQGVFTSAALKEWQEAAETANALVNRKIKVDSKMLPMDSKSAA